MKKYTIGTESTELCAAATKRNSAHMLPVADWLNDLPENTQLTDLIEVQFKNTRKGYFHNAIHLPLEKGVKVVVEANPGYDLGEVVLTGKLVELQIKKNKIDTSRYEIRQVLRIATEEDLERAAEAHAREQETMIKARQLNSPAVEANAWHHRSDALSSLGTTVGIGGAIFLGQRWTVLDPIASVIVGAFIVKVAIDLLRNGIGDLMEQSLPDAVEEEMLRLVATLPGDVKPHDLRTRRIGNHYAIELHILMDGDISLKEAHDKASEVEDLLRERYGEETHVAVHVEPK